MGQAAVEPKVAERKPHMICPRRLYLKFLDLAKLNKIFGLIPRQSPNFFGMPGMDQEPVDGEKKRKEKRG